MNSYRRFPTVLLLVLVALAAGCSDRDIETLAPAQGDTNALVYGDDYGGGAYFQPFFETHYLTASHDSVFAWPEGSFAPDGARSLKMEIPPAGSALGAYSGGVITATGARNLSGYNALTFYARTDSFAAKTILLNEVGYGNDNTGNSLYGAGRNDLPLTPEWTFHVVPIPAPSKLLSERGLFLFAEGLENWTPGDYGSGHPYPDGYNIWFDEIRFAKLDNIEIFRAQMNPVDSQYFVGSTVNITGTLTIFRVDGVPMIVNHQPGYFDYVSSDPSVATVGRNVITVIDAGQSTITATMEGVDVVGNVRVTGYDPPTVAADPPTLPAQGVISMFSDVYNDVPVDTWNTGWGGSTANVQDYQVAGDNTKMYTSLNFVGIEFLNPTIDASAMTHFHLDVYAPDGTDFKVKLVSFPPALTSGVETQDVVLDADSVPPFNGDGTWSSLDIPLSDFVLPADWDWAHVGQLVLSTTDAQLVLVDNVYWHD